MLQFRYVFVFADGHAIEHAVRIDPRTLVSEIEMPVILPDWARPESPGDDLADVALRLVEPIRKFGHLISHEKALVTVEGPDRAYTRYTDVQDGLRSLFGLIIATSGIPALSRFKIMARFHLPFSTLEETILRVVSVCLLERYVEDKPIDSNAIFEAIRELYATTSEINRRLLARIRAGSQKDAATNAVVILDAMSMLVPLNTDEMLKEFRHWFEEEKVQ